MVKVAHHHHHHHSANSFDLYSPQRSPLHQWEPRCKIVGLLGLIIAIALVNRWELTPVIFVVSMGLYWLSKSPWQQWRDRLKYPTGFVLVMVALLPLTAGKTITGWTLGPW
ncbi:MAG: energy-coupling factor transporter transmembrane protein EcfT, partial [Cyanobacteria bacterium P01_F01_bin.153]